MRRVLAVNAVGGISPGHLAADKLVFPDQIIDYTYGRDHTFFGSELRQVTHVDFTAPYCDELRQVLIQAARQAEIASVERGTSRRHPGAALRDRRRNPAHGRDGADIVGMTGMPEACLARELELCYASVAVVVNLPRARPRVRSA